MKQAIAFLCKVIFGVLSTIWLLYLIRPWTVSSLDRDLHPCAETRTSQHINLPLCPETPPNLRSNVQPEERRRRLEKDPSILSHVQPGGTWQPRDCRAREHVAIIVPYRDREEHLPKFLVHMHQFLQKQQLHYTVFIAEMTQGTMFNTGMMQNLGFQIADAMSNFTCFVIHDVDLLPTNENNLYRCNYMTVIHPATNNSKYGYKKKYSRYIGGAVIVTRQQYYSVNGFSNLYFGWGYQDDDFRRRYETLKRLDHVHIPVYNVPMNIGVYEALSHGDDAGNPKKQPRREQKRTIIERMHVEGLNTLKYKLRRLELKPLYTWILVEVDRDKIMGKFLQKKA